MMKATYRIVPIAQKTNVKPGNPIFVEIFIAGYGNIKSSKLQALHPHESLIDNSNPGSLVYSVDVVERNRNSAENGYEIQVGDRVEAGPFAIDDHGTMALLSPVIFTDQSYANSMVDSLPKASESEVKPIIGEHAHDNDPPLLLKINTRETASGDYTIPFILTYSELDGSVRQSSDSVSIHMTSWVERHRLLLEIIAVIGVLAAVAALYFG